MIVVPDVFACVSEAFALSTGPEAYLPQKNAKQYTTIQSRPGFRIDPHNPVIRRYLRTLLSHIKEDNRHANSADGFLRCGKGDDHTGERHGDTYDLCCPWDYSVD